MAESRCTHGRKSEKHIKRWKRIKTAERCVSRESVWDGMLIRRSSLRLQMLKSDRESRDSPCLIKGPIQNLKRLLTTISAISPTLLRILPLSLNEET